jgi:hypothetical protein
MNHSPSHTGNSDRKFNMNVIPASELIAIQAVSASGNLSLSVGGLQVARVVLLLGRGCGVVNLNLAAAHWSEHNSNFNLEELQVVLCLNLESKTCTVPTSSSGRLLI